VLSKKVGPCAWKPRDSGAADAARWQRSSSKCTYANARPALSFTMKQAGVSLRRTRAVEAASVLSYFSVAANASYKSRILAAARLRAYEAM
jgi:hypothetical protein